MKIHLDKFYTKKETVEHILSKVNNIITSGKFEQIVEPSAGDGVWLKDLKKFNIPTISYDISPDNEEIIKQDYLKLDNVNLKNTLVIGNPPFGERSKLAKDFIKHSIKLGADTIAFILPKTFLKITMQKVFPKDFKLISIVNIDEHYRVDNREDYFVPTIFLIFSTRECFNDYEDLREQEVKTPTEYYKFVSRENNTADITINGNSGKVKTPNEVTNPKAEHYIEITDKENKNEIINVFKNATYTFHSSVNGGNAWINKNDINKYFISNKKKAQLK